MLIFIDYSEPINILHPIYDSLICFNSVKSQQIDYNHISLWNIIDALVQSGILVEIRSYREGFGKVRKSIKFLFITPSLRTGMIF
ncbi:hypothetical protein MSIBF_A1660017 [groundwater metagenome]|uniref:Uncharacterized protein n=1 Tax=groundwater metagenome TaxID=717931 RepID=A0A098E896_9ZZZZ